MTAFIIDRDHLSEKYPDFKSSRVGLIGPSTVSRRDVERLNAKPREGIAFKLYDDDGVLYYEGRRLEESDCDELYDAEPELAPLDCFGMPDSGCTEQRERDADGQWEAL